MTIREQYFKERRRIQRFLRDARKRGYVFPENALPGIPNNIKDGSVRKLKKITPESLYKKAKWVDPKTGFVTKGEKGRQKEKHESAKKAAETRKRNKERREQEDGPEAEYYDFTPEWAEIVISNFYYRLSEFPRAEGARFLESWLEDIHYSEGTARTAEMLQHLSDTGYKLNHDTLYNLPLSQSLAIALMQYLPDHGERWNREHPGVMDDLTDSDEEFDLE